MLDQLFEHPSALQYHRNGPLLESRLRYLNYCAERGASKNTLRQLAYEMLVIIKGLQLDKVAGPIDFSAIENAAHRWASRLPHPQPMKHSQRLFISVATNWLRYIGCLRPQPPALLPYASLLDDFINYLSHERDFSKASLPNFRSRLGDFLSQLHRRNCPLNKLSIAEIQDIIAAKGQEGWTRITIRSYCYALRVFLRYAEMHGWCKTGLASAIMSPCIFKDTALPVGPSWETVQRLIASIGDRKPTDIRDRAIVMLMAVYGLRSMEVGRLRIEDMDWDKEQMVVHHAKQGPVQPYPLSYPVGEAILRYLKEVRPRGPYREIFLTVRSPIQPLSCYRLRGLVRDRLLALNIPLNHYGPHSLRHACASHLLAEGLSLKEIGDYLGHRHPDSTRIYAKVDLIGLREVADFSLGGLL